MDDETRLNEMLSIWQRLRQQGTDPALAELCRDYPELLPELERRIRALLGMSELLRDPNSSLSFSDPPPFTEPSTVSYIGQAPDVPGYEIVGELGRGGMGIVYKARDLTLKRLVALKMILAGSRAAGENLARFRAEAEAVARLHHPHIVQVFSGGEHDGQPFFVMEFVEGGSLEKKLHGEAQPPRDAARLVLLLARAVHYAHQQGIVHRDLKPANVLLAPNADEPALNCAYGCPRLTDFGLSKCLDNTGDRTATGTVMGTPSYMAPEQAMGDTDTIGPATDVWALGIILYEMLTGVLPFKGVSDFETMQQICTSPPDSPRRLCSEVPPDLEGICLKCLQKAPGERYASGAALAEDLSSFLAEAPVSAPAVRDSSRHRARSRVMAAFAATLVLVGGFMWALWPRGPARGLPEGQPESAVLPPPKGYVDVLIYDATNPQRQDVPLGQAGVLPLRVKDEVAVVVNLDRPAYVYVLWIDADGGVAPVYPWRGGKWEDRPAEEKPVQQVRRPEALVSRCGSSARN